jgi:hypothetical protein
MQWRRRSSKRVGFFHGAIRRFTENESGGISHRLSGLPRRRGERRHARRSDRMRAKGGCEARSGWITIHPGDIEDRGSANQQIAEGRA